jgi:hypothetical protein
VLRSLVLTDVQEFYRWSSVAEWTRISVQWQSLQSLAISVPRPEDSSAHEQMFEAVTALETLTLDFNHRGLMDPFGALSIHFAKSLLTFSMQPWILAQSLCLGCTSGWTMRNPCPRCLVFFARHPFHGCSSSTSRSLSHFSRTP